MRRWHATPSTCARASKTCPRCATSAGPSEPMSGTVLSLNAGSSTLKFGLYRLDQQSEDELVSDTLKTPDGAQLAALDVALDRVRALGGPEPAVVGHRLVHR